MISKKPKIAYDVMYFTKEGKRMKIHIVKKGDNLWIIAQKYNVDMQYIIEANPQIKNPDKLEIGKKIIIPQGHMSKEKIKYPVPQKPYPKKEPIESPESPEPPKAPPKRPVPMESPESPESPVCPVLPKMPLRPMPYMPPCNQVPMIPQFDDMCNGHWYMNFGPQMPYGQMPNEQMQTPYKNKGNGQMPNEQMKMPYGQKDNGQMPYGQMPPMPYGQMPYGQNPHGQMPPMPYGQNPHGQMPMPYGQMGYGQMPYMMDMDPCKQWPEEMYDEDRYHNESSSST